MSIENLFPLKGKITQEIIDKADTMDPSNCIGALTLGAALEGKITKEDSIISWGVYTGLNEINGQAVRLTTEEDIDMMDVIKPQKVTFIIDEIL